MSAGTARYPSRSCDRRWADPLSASTTRFLQSLGEHRSVRHDLSGKLPGDAIALAFRRPDRPSIGVSADSMCREEGGSRLGGTSLTGRWRGRHREVSKVLGQLCIEGYAIVSTDGIIAHTRRRLADELKVEATT